MIEKECLSKIINNIGVSETLRLIGEICADKANQLKDDENDDWLNWESVALWLIRRISTHPTVNLVK